MKIHGSRLVLMSFVAAVAWLGGGSDGGLVATAEAVIGRPATPVSYARASFDRGRRCGRRGRHPRRWCRCTGCWRHARPGRCAGQPRWTGQPGRRPLSS